MKATTNAAVSEAKEIVRSLCDLVERIRDSEPEVQRALRDVLDHVRFEAAHGDDGRHVIGESLSLWEADVAEGVQTALCGAGGLDFRDEDELVDWRASVKGAL